jgi:hypothetical protein
MNISSDVLIEWCMGLEVDGLTAKILTGPVNIPPILGKNFEVVMYSAAKRGFPILLGCSVKDYLYPNQSWIGSLGSVPYANGSFTPYHAHCPPQIFPTLCGDEWYSIRMLEWGISGPSPSANFSGEVVVYGPPQRQGWYSNKGDPEYDKRVISRMPL